MPPEPEPCGRAVAATLKDVARLARVAPVTVSRVINGEDTVKASTKARVLEAVAALNYVPNLAARRLAGARAINVAIGYDNPSSGFLNQVLIGALDECGRLGIQLSIVKTVRDENISALAQRLARGGVNGMLVGPTYGDVEGFLDTMEAAGITVVINNPSKPQPGVSGIRIDNEAAAREVADHLLALGHRRFGHIAGPPRFGDSQMRQKGFVEQLGRAGVGPEMISVAQGAFTYWSGLQAAEQLLAAEQRPTAIFAANDDMAAAALAVANRLGLVVPRDLSIVGFDDSPIASEVWPALTTVRQPTQETAAQAIRLVDELIRQGDQKTHRLILMPHTLVERMSTGVAP